MSGGKVCNRLVGHIHLHFGSRIGLDSVEKFLLELSAHNDGQHKAVEQIVAMNVCKRTADDHTHTITGNGPCGMLATGT